MASVRSPWLRVVSSAMPLTASFIVGVLMLVSRRKLSAWRVMLSFSMVTNRLVSCSCAGAESPSLR